MFVENYRLDTMIGGQAVGMIPYPKISDDDWAMELVGGGEWRNHKRCNKKADNRNMYGPPERQPTHETFSAKHVLSEVVRTQSLQGKIWSWCSAEKYHIPNDLD